jgi:hypothetical protein
MQSESKYIHEKDCVFIRRGNKLLLDDQLIEGNLLTAVPTGNNNFTKNNFSEAFSNNLILPTAFLKTDNVEDEEEEAEAEEDRVISDSLYDKLLELAHYTNHDGTIHNGTIHNGTIHNDTTNDDDAKPRKKKTRSHRIKNKRNKTAKTKDVIVNIK